MPEERPQCLGHREDKLAVGQVQKDFARKMLGEQQRRFLTARRTEVETLAAKWPEVVVTTGWIGAPDACHSKPAVPTGQKPLADVPDPLQAEHAVFGGLFLIVRVAEPLEMPVEDRVQLIAIPGNVASRG